MSKKSSGTEDVAMADASNLLDPQDFWTGGLLPVGRVRLTLGEGKASRKQSEDGRAYTSIYLPYTIVYHESIPSSDPRMAKGFLEKGKFFFNTLGKTVHQFKNLYEAATGHEIKPTVRDADGRAKFDINGLVAELKGLQVYGAYLWRKDENEVFEGRIGWDFGRLITDVYCPVNRYATNESSEESYNDDDN
jgi:hypothetical protein